MGMEIFSVVKKIKSMIVGTTGNVAEVNDTGQLKVVLDGRVDTGNSSATPLLTGAEFTGTGVDTLDYALFFVTVYSDVASATDGLCVQVSSDNITWRDGDCYTVPAATEKTFSFQPNKKYMRVHYTNGSSDQTVFDLHTILKKTNSKPSSHRIQDAIVDEDDSELVKAVLTGENGAKVFTNVQVDLTGRIKVVSQPYEYSVAEGAVLNHSPVRRFGLNSDVGTSLETICPESKLYVYLTSAEILSIVSTSANDTAAGTGMQSIYIQGLDTNYALQAEVVALNGTTPVNTVNLYIRVLAAYGQTVGTNSGNAGIITVRNNAATNTLCTIPIGEGRCNSAIFTVPAGYTFYLTSWYGSENSNKGSSVSLWKRAFADGGWQLVRLYTLIDSLFENELKSPLVFPEKSDVEMRAKGVLAGANVAGGFYGWMELN